MVCLSLLLRHHSGATAHFLSSNLAGDLPGSDEPLAQGTHRLEHDRAAALYWSGYYWHPGLTGSALAMAGTLRPKAL